MSIETGPLKVVDPYAGIQNLFNQLDMSWSDKGSISWTPNNI